MRKSVKLTNKIIAELEKHGNVLNTCSKVGISTSTYYRWCDDDSEFNSKVNDAIEIGRMNITDLAESKLIQNITNGDQRAIEFQLRGNDRRYMPMNHKNMHDWMEEFKEKNDLTKQKENLEFVASGLIDMYKEDDYRKLLLSKLASNNLMPKYPKHRNTHYQFTEKEYVGRILGSEVMQDVLNDLKQKLGEKFAEEMGKKNYEDTEDNNPDTRRQRMIDVYRSIENAEEGDDMLG